ncbi:Smg-4/UPF3 family-domain-containing protein, partial [Dipodascopsis tothii]|uniref:Smg-4/UPF3 family-domain-containing protein n=1 Tax=Dipodascopsis tothii TaxID=44089 RepID=UPI0034CEA0F7
MSGRKILLQRGDSRAGAEREPRPDRPAGPPRAGERDGHGRDGRDGRDGRPDGRGERDRAPRRPPDEPLKVVVRHLPPLLSETEFAAAVAEWTPDEAVEYKYYVAGKIPKNRAKPPVDSRAYIKFRTLDQVVTFNKAFGGHALADSKGTHAPGHADAGNRRQTVVELAPYGKVPKQRRRADPRENTID